MYIDGMDLDIGNTLMRQQRCHFSSDSLRRQWRHPHDRFVGIRRCLDRIVNVGEQRASALGRRRWQDG